MEIRPIFVLLGLFAANGALADAYVWTDEEGVVHYSDRPHPGAKVLDLGEATPRRRTPVSQSAASTPEPADESADQQQGPFRYESLAVVTPASEETLWNIEGVLNVSLALSPALKPGHRVRVYFDGNPRPVIGTSFRLTEVYRGAHNLQAEVLDENGELMIRSQPSRFYVQQNTVRFR